MTLDQLRVFVAVADREHMTRAAEAMNVTQSTATAAVQALERMHQVVLFHRIGRRIELTDAGRTFLGEAKALLAHAALVQGTLAELGGAARGTLTIAASHTIGSYWLPPRLVRFRQAFPDSEVLVSVGTTTQVRKAVLEGTAEVGFVGTSVSDEKLTQSEIGRDALSIVVGAEHPWAQAAHIATEELMRGRWVMREPGSGTRAEFARALAERGFDPGDLHVMMELPTDEALHEAVKAGIGATVLSGLATRAVLRDGALRMVSYALPDRTFYALQHRERYKTKLATELIALVTSA